MIDLRTRCGANKTLNYCQYLVEKEFCIAPLEPHHFCGSRMKPTGKEIHPTQKEPEMSSMFTCICGNSLLYRCSGWVHNSDNTPSCDRLVKHTITGDPVEPESFTKDQLVQIVKVLSEEYKQIVRIIEETKDAINQ